jgi:transposase-like protein
MGRGRNREYTAKEMVEAIEAEDGVVKDVAERLGCDRTTVYRYRKRYKTVAQALERARTDLVYEARDRLKDLMRSDGHKDQYRAIVKILEVFDDEYDWGDRQKTDITSGGDPVENVRLNVIHTDADDFEQETRTTNSESADPE